MLVTTSLAGIAAMWSGLMAVVVLGLMVIARPRLIGTVLGRWLSFIVLDGLALGFVIAALLVAFVWPESIGIVGNVAPAISLVLCIYIVVMLVLFVALVILPTRPERGGDTRTPTVRREPS
jgi:hypothetical protein